MESHEKGDLVREERVESSDIITTRVLPGKDSNRNESHEKEYLVPGIVQWTQFYSTVLSYNVSQTYFFVITLRSPSL